MYVSLFLIYQMPGVWPPKNCMSDMAHQRCRLWYFNCRNSVVAGEYAFCTKSTPPRSRWHTLSALSIKERGHGVKNFGEACSLGCGNQHTHRLVLPDTWPEYSLICFYIQRAWLSSCSLLSSAFLYVFVWLWGPKNTNFLNQENKYFTCPYAVHIYWAVHASWYVLERGLVMGKLCSSLHPSRWIPVYISFRYSNTLLVTFNNRIALRNMNKDHAFASGKTGGVGASTHGPMVFAVIDVESFRATPHSSIESISASESFGLKVSST